MRKALVERFVLALLGSSLLTGCFQLPAPAPAAPADGLTVRVQAALKDRPEDALAYAGLYAVLADRLDASAYDTTATAAATAGKAADIVGIPGVLKEVVNDELNPLLGKPQPLTPELAAKAAAKLRLLSAACREAAR